MARLSSVNYGDVPDARVNLDRLLRRLRQSLITPDAVSEQKLRTSREERARIRGNIEYAKEMLLRIEQDTSSIKAPSRKQDAQVVLLRKRDDIQLMQERLDEIESLEYLYVQVDAEDEPSDDEDDAPGEDTPSASDDKDSTDYTPPEAPSPVAPLASPVQAPTTLTAISDPQEAGASTHGQLFGSSELRARNKQDGENIADAHTTSSDYKELSTAETLLTHNRMEQESLTESLVAMAQALKESTQQFSSSLESEKDTVGRAVEGLDRSTDSMTAAQRSMGYLRRLSEGKGWWGRMLMYAWIAGLMFTAFFIVAFMPKLRF